MLLASTRKSVRDREVSALALTETLISTVVAFVICWYAQSLHYIAGAALIAPFLLLRTEHSSKLALRWAAAASRKLLPYIGGLGDAIDDSHPVIRFPLIAVFAILFAIATVLIYSLIKITSTTYALFRHPIITLGAIPDNWRMVVLCTDLHAIPELLPGIEDADEVTANEIGWSRLSEIIQNFEPKLDFDALLGVLVVPIYYIPAVLYRWSLKSTAIVWFPLVWTLSPIQKSEDLGYFTEDVVYRPLYKIGRVYAYFIILLGLAKLALLIYWAHVSRELPQPLRLILSAYLVPDGVAAWHIAAFAGAVLTIMIYLHANSYLIDKQRGEAIGDASVRSYFQWIFVVRAVLAVYTALCTTYITASLAHNVEIPPLRFILFPW